MISSGPIDSPPPPKVRAYKVAEELGITPDELVQKTRTLGIDIKNKMSLVEAVDADRIRRAVERERQETLVEERLTDTVIRRRSKAGPAAKSKLVETPKPAPAASLAEVDRVRVETPGPPADLVEVTSPPVAVESPRPRVETPASAPAGSSDAAATSLAASAGALAQAAGPAVRAADRPSVKSIPTSVITGSAATGAFIQLPGHGPRGGAVDAGSGIPRIEIKDRDEELRRLRGGIAARLPSGRDRFGRPGGGYGAPGQRTGAPPKKRVAAAGKKLKQTQITTPAEHKRVVRMDESIAVADLAQKMGVKGNEVVKKLWGLGMMGININQSIDHDTAVLIAGEFGYQVESTAFSEEKVIAEGEPLDNPEDLVPRAPVVTIMGHVDHGKTSLLDAIRKANVAGGEAGGITQHIGAYKVRAERGDVVFLDTPGHEAFTAMRARGAQMTDIVVLVVAADDGPMPQTVEAINHARAAEVPILVAVNKIDKPGADPAQIRRRLMEHALVPEELGGDTIFIDVSARTKQGIDRLLEMLALQAEVLELRANPKKAAKGHVVEARLDRSRGPISTILVEEGTLKLGDLLVAGEWSGKIRAMADDKGQSLEEAGPSTPLEVLGLDGVPDAGETFNVVTDEKSAKTLVEHRAEQKRRKAMTAVPGGRVSLENILDKIKAGDVKEVKIVLKADVQGSVEALSKALTQLGTEQVGVTVISSGVGGITESDISLAKASDAIVIGFAVRPAGKSSQLADQEGVDIKLYEVIYDAIDDVKKAMLGMLSPVLKERIVGRCEVRQVFTIPKAGTIAGSAVTEGKISRKNQVRLIRDSVVVHTGRVGSLRRFKEDASEVTQGYECGIGIENFGDVKVGDVIESFEVESVAATLDAPVAAGKKS